MLYLSLIFAFGFTSPAMLAWMAVAVAPLLIHLLSRRRYRETTWAAMEYLVAAMQQSRRRLQFEHILLLIVRTLIVVLAVAAVADPYLDQGSFVLTASDARTHRVLVIDGSYSMSCRDDEGVTRLQRAKTLARRLVEDSQPGDSFSLLLMGSPPRVIVKTPVLASGDFLAALDEVVQTQTSFDLPATLESVEDLLTKAPNTASGLERTEVYFLTDLCKVGWQPKFSTTASKNMFRRRLSRLTEVASLVIVDVGQGDVANRAIVDLHVDEPFAMQLKPLDVTATVKYFSPRPQSQMGVELWVDGLRAARRNIELPAKGSATATFVHRFATAGEHIMEVRIPEDRLTLDNRRWLALPVKTCLQVLCVDGNPSAAMHSSGPHEKVQLGGGACDYLVLALSPGGKQSLPAWVCPTVVAESDLMEKNLARYDCVFLCNVSQFTSSEAEALQRYVQAGGALIFFLGDRVLPDRYNRRLSQGNSNRNRILPARLKELVERRQEGLDPLDYRHTIVDKFRGREQAGLLTMPVEKYYKLVLADDSKANIVLATRDCDPLIVEESIGRGRVVLVGTSADTSWGSLPIWPSFVPLVHEILTYAVGKQIDERNRLVGSRLEGPIVETEQLLLSTAASVDVKTPQSTYVKATVDRRDGTAYWSFDDTATSGIYTIVVDRALSGALANIAVQTEETSASEQQYAINVNTIESNLTKLSQEQLRSGVLSGVPLEYRTIESPSQTAHLESIARPARLAGGLLWAVFSFLLLEHYMAWRFSHHT